MPLFQILLRAHAQKKKTKWHTFLGLGPTSLSYSAKVASYPLKLGSRPYNNIF